MTGIYQRLISIPWWIYGLAALSFVSALVIAPSAKFIKEAQAAQSSVSMAGMAFSPATITIAAGDTVVWTNSSSLQHTVTADDGSFDSGTINPGGTYSHTFMTPGTYRYYCRFHGAPGGVGMSGVIVVTASNNQTPSSNPPPNTNMNMPPQNQTMPSMQMNPQPSSYQMPQTQTYTPAYTSSNTQQYTNSGATSYSAAAPTAASSYPYSVYRHLCHYVSYYYYPQYQYQYAQTYYPQQYGYSSSSYNSSYSQPSYGYSYQYSYPSQSYSYQYPQNSYTYSSNSGGYY